MIVSCPACGTHFKHETLPVPARGRCGRCDASIERLGLRAYRLAPDVEPVAEARSASRSESPVGAAVLATAVAAPGIDPRPAAPPPADWDTEDPLPPIPEMAVLASYERAMPAPEGDMLGAAAPRDEALPAEVAGALPREGRGTTWVLWLAAGAIVGTGTSWTLGGTTLAGISYGALVGAVIGVGWLRWTSPR